LYFISEALPVTTQDYFFLKLDRSLHGAYAQPLVFPFAFDYIINTSNSVVGYFNDNLIAAGVKKIINVNRHRAAVGFGKNFFSVFSGNCHTGFMRRFNLNPQRIPVIIIVPFNKAYVLFKFHALPFSALEPGKLFVQ